MSSKTRYSNHKTIIKVESIRASDVKVNTFNCPRPLKIEVSLKVLYIQLVDN